MRLARAIPVLASQDLQATMAFYRQRLGFEEAFQVEDYGGVRRDGVEIHFWKCDDRKIAESTSCRIVVEDVDALYADLKRSGVIHPNGALEDKPWGWREFAAVDGDGNLLTFVQKV